MSSLDPAALPALPPALRSWPARALLLFAAAWPTAAQPCGPFFPPRMLVGKNALVLEAPVADLWRELTLVAERSGLAKDAPPANAEQGDALEKAVGTDVVELRAALAKGTLPAHERDALANAYEQARRAYLRYAGPTRDFARERAAAGDKNAVPAWAALLDAPKGTPAEFADYLAGAKAFYLGRADEARARFEALLARPPAERRDRSTWAAFMLGRLAADDATAIAAFRRVRALRREGFADRLGLAAESLGEEARHRFRQGDLVGALELYARQHATGERGAAMSVRFVVRRAFAAGAPTLRALAKSTVARRAVAAFLVARGGPAYAMGVPPKQLVAPWLAAIEAEAKGDVEGADRFAWASYRQGDFAGARRWAERAGDKAVLARWIRAKLALRDGHLDEAARLLGEVVRGLRADERWQDVADYERGELGRSDTSPRALAFADLGGVQLARKEIVESLESFLRAAYWTDAAYLAERVLTLDELRAAVLRLAPNAPPEPAPSKRRFAPKPTADTIAGARDLRWLFARRLVRAGRLAEAAPYMPKEHGPALEAYARNLDASRDPKKDAKARARARFEAAFALRAHGLEIFGTELEPDYALHGGNFQTERASDERQKPIPGAALPPSEEEQKRLRAHAVAPDKRWHYRYVAADMAFEAASAFGTNDEEAARMLCRAGTWVKYRDPPFADRFYKALARRHPQTPLGKLAAATRWFPAVCR